VGEVKKLLEEQSLKLKVSLARIQNTQNGLLTKKMTRTQQKKRVSNLLPIGNKHKRKGDKVSNQYSSKPVSPSKQVGRMKKGSKRAPKIAKSKKKHVLLPVTNTDHHDDEEKDGDGDEQETEVEEEEEEEDDDDSKGGTAGIGI